MADTNINKVFARFEQKIDTYENWSKSNAETQAAKSHGDLVLGRGEIAFCEIPAGNNEATTAPTVLFKVGDGKKPFKELKWGSALAADVYAWAKHSSLFSTVAATETINGDKTYVGNAVTNVEWDTTLNEGKGGLKFTKGTQFATKAELDAALEAFGGDLDAITDTDTRYTFAIPTDGDNAGKLAVTAVKYINGEAEGPGTTTYYDFVTPGELEKILKDYVKSISGEKAIEIDNQDKQNPVVKLKIADIESPDPYKDVILTQDSNGLKAEFDLSKIGLSGDKEVLIVGTPTLGVLHDLAVTEDATIGGALEVTGNITTGGKEVATKEDIVAAVAGAVDYLGAVDSAAALTLKQESATHGDFVRVSISFDGYHAGDLLVWHKEEGSEGHWVQIHGEEGDITKITAGEGLELSADSGDGSVGDITINVKNSGITTDKIADKAVTETKLEQNVQDALALARTALQEPQDITGKADKVKDAVSGNFAGLDENGNLTDSGKKASDFKAIATEAIKHTSVTAENDTSTIKTVTNIEQDVNGNITKVDFAPIGKIAAAASADRATGADVADIAKKLDTRSTLGVDNGAEIGVVIENESITFCSAGGGIDYTWRSDDVRIGVGSSQGKGRLIVDENTEEGGIKYTTIEGGTVTTEKLVADAIHLEHDIGGVNPSVDITGNEISVTSGQVVVKDLYNTEAVASLTSNKLTVNEAAIGGVEIKSNESAGVKYFVFSAGTASTLI